MYLNVQYKGQCGVFFLINIIAFTVIAVIVVVLYKPQRIGCASYDYTLWATHEHAGRHQSSNVIERRTKVPHAYKTHWNQIMLKPTTIAPTIDRHVSVAIVTQKHKQQQQFAIWNNNRTGLEWVFPFHVKLLMEKHFTALVMDIELIIQPITLSNKQQLPYLLKHFDSINQLLWYIIVRLRPRRLLVT